ncbi:MAG: hypothetical protein MJZ18_08460 [Bacteroidales bacterium]|nr:hypothetical protein [Bacteroidales bacterium]
MSRLGYILKSVVAAISVMVVAVGVYLDEHRAFLVEGNGVYLSSNDSSEREQYVELSTDISYTGYAVESISIPAPTSSSLERNKVQWGHTQSRSLVSVLICDLQSRLSANNILLTTSEAIALCNSSRSCDYYVYAERKMLI